MDRLREEIEAAFVVERVGWAFDRVTRVTTHLQHDVVAGERLETLVIWSETHDAFTAPGRTVYFSRRLLEQLPDDDAAAFVIAHELAHHRLGHVPPLPRAALVLPIRLILAMLERWIAGSRHERDADLLAIEMCIDAGYDVEKCLHALTQLANVALDHGDVDAVLGGPVEGSHPPLHDRIAAARAHAAHVARGHRLAVELAERRRERNRRVAILGGAAAAAVVLVLLRRGPR